MNSKIADILRTERLLLWKPSQWDWIPFDKKVSCYNGVGADRFPVYVRWLLTLVNPLFLPAVVIHDFDYTYTQGGYWGFTISNLRLAVNMILCASYILLITLNILLAPLKILIYPIICQAFGYTGYCIKKEEKYTIKSRDV